MPTIRTQPELDRYCAFLRTQRLPLECEHRKWTPERSQEQLGAQFGLAYKVIMAETGLRGDKDKKKLHADFCGEYFGWKFKTVLGKKWRDPVRTTSRDENGKRVKFSKTEQAEFYAFVVQIAAECGIFVPEPDPNWKTST